ncbi:MAG: glycosyltransferase family 1 protein [Anaerolineae bacterium]|nr:glycosyltransferase family 4 protein [Thermoflexales bacterium]MDW8395379.1 glycosyltransferase family 1 protein [Anaerolineae bacterium]
MTTLVALGAYLLSGTAGYRQAGVHTYAHELLRALPEATKADAWAREQVRFLALLSPTVTRPDLALPWAHASQSTEQPLRRIWVEQVETLRCLRAERAALYHGLGFVVPLRATCPTVVSVMDLSFITQPQTHRWLNRIYLSLLTRLSCRRSARVIAISAWTKRDVVRYFGMPPERVDVTLLGADQARFKPLPAEQVAAFRAKHGISERAVFFLGSLEPRKNLSRLLDAFAQLSPRLAPQLFVGGSLAWKYHAVLERAERPDLRGRVRFIGRVAPEVLPLWYNACAVTAYPSLYEGFGLPALEAMACGAAVLASDVTSLPEVVGDAGLLVNPLSVAAIADGLRQLLEDEQLRRTLRERALARAAQFTWARTAQQTLATYRAVLSADAA